MNRLIHSHFSRYTRQGLWSIFLLCAFPLHVWAILLFLRDISWLSERTNLWDAVGVGSYALIFAFAESIFVFLVLVILGIFLTPGGWTAERRISFLSLLGLILSIWAVISQLLFLWNIHLPSAVIQILIRSGRPLVGLYVISLSIVIPTVVLPVYQFLRSEKTANSIQSFSERLSSPMVAYLFLDLAGLVIVVIRNIPHL